MKTLHIATLLAALTASAYAQTPIFSESPRCTIIRIQSSCDFPNIESFHLSISFLLSDPEERLRLESTYNKFQQSTTTLHNPHAPYEQQKKALTALLDATQYFLTTATPVCDYSTLYLDAFHRELEHAHNVNYQINGIDPERLTLGDENWKTIESRLERLEQHRKRCTPPRTNISPPEIPPRYFASGSKAPV